MSSHNIAPVVITAFKRSWHLEQNLLALSKNLLARETELYIYCDGPKKGEDDEIKSEIKKVVSIARGVDWCKKLNVIVSDTNLGLLRSFEKAISEVIGIHGKVIVLEEDQVTSPGFLVYMNEALELYENDDGVMCISGYMYPADYRTTQTSFFLNVQTCPGWATWSRAWKNYISDVESHVSFFASDKRKIRDFDLGGYAYWHRQLIRNVDFPGFSFAVRWYSSCYRNGGLTLFPNGSLVRNIGLDGTGEHCGVSDMYDVHLVDSINLRREEIVESKHIRKSVGLFYEKHHKFSIFEKLKNYKTWVLRKIGIKISGNILLGSIPILSRLKWNETQNNFVGTNCKVESSTYMRNTQIGDYSYLGKGCSLSLVTVGKFCSIGPNCLIGWGIHPINGVSTSPMFYSLNRQNGITLSYNNKIIERKKITIGNDVFIGANVTVLDGVTIGDGAVVGAGCVVSKDVPPYSVVVGSPMQVLRYRFDEKIISRLLNLRWWDSNTEVLQALERNFFSVEEFLDEIEYKNGK